MAHHKCWRTRAHVLGPRGRPGPGPRANAYSNNYISGGRPPIRGDTWYVHVLRRGSICPPHHAGCPKGKIQILHLEGGIPRGGSRRGRQSTAAWLSRPTEIFSSVSPFAGPTENFTSAPPLSRGEACGSLPLAGTFGSPSTVLASPASFTLPI